MSVRPATCLEGRACEHKLLPCFFRSCFGAAVFSVYFCWFGIPPQVSNCIPSGIIPENFFAGRILVFTHRLIEFDKFFWNCFLRNLSQQHCQPGAESKNRISQELLLQLQILTALHGMQRQLAQAATNPQEDCHCLAALPKQPNSWGVASSHCFKHLQPPRHHQSTPFKKGQAFGKRLGLEVSQRLQVALDNSRRREHLVPWPAPVWAKKCVAAFPWVGDSLQPTRFASLRPTASLRPNTHHLNPTNSHHWTHHSFGRVCLTQEVHRHDPFRLSLLQTGSTQVRPL